MLAFTLAWLDLAAIAGITTLLGWAVTRRFAIREVRGRSVESLISHAFVGTSVVVLVFGWLSLAGLTGKQIAWIFIVGAGLLIAASLVRDRKQFTLSRPRTPATWLFLASLAIAALMQFRLLRACDCPEVFNDTMTYLAISDWLQDHPFSAALANADPDRPSTCFIWLYQTFNLRMGSTYFLALTQAVARQHVLRVYPIVMTWGLFLNLGGIYLLCRWAFRMTPWFSSAAVLFVAAGWTPLQTTIDTGFQPQLFGTSYLLFSVALLSRCVRPGQWRLERSILVGASIATFLSVYSDMAPVLALTAASFIGVQSLFAWREKQMRPWLRFVSFTLLASIALGNIEWYRAYSALRTQISVVVGLHIPWTTSDFLAFAAGASPFNLISGSTSGQRWAAIACGLALAAGLITQGRRQRAFAASMTFLVFAGLFGYFWLLARNPFTQGIGHSWSTFKVCKWAFPLLIAFQFAGLQSLLRGRRFGHLLVIVPAVLIAIGSKSAYRIQLNYNRMAVFANTPTPVRAWLQFRERLHELQPIDILFLDAQQQHAPQFIVPQLVSPYPLANGWANCSYDGLRSSDRPLAPGGIVLAWADGVPSSDNVLERFPGNLVMLDPSQPNIYAVTSKAEPDRRARNKGLRIGPAGADFSVWAPEKKLARLDVKPVSGDLAGRRMVVLLPDGQTRDIALDAIEPILVSVPAGRSQITITCPDNSDGSTESGDRSIPFERISLRFLSDDLEQVTSDR